MRSWTINFTMDGVEPRYTNIPIGFFESSLWKMVKMVTIFQKCMTTEVGS